MAKAPVLQADEEVDLTPMIDLVFLLIIFFILAGKVTSQSRAEQITVPPTTTAVKLPPDPKRIIINVFGTTKSGDPPAGTIGIGTERFRASGIDDYSHYQALRRILDRQYDLAEKVDDVKNPALKIPKNTVVEIRADGDTEYRMVQEVLQVVTDSVDPKDMTPRTVAADKMKPFIHINYTTRVPGEN